MTCLDCESSVRSPFLLLLKILSVQDKCRYSRQQEKSIDNEKNISTGARKIDGGNQLLE